MSSNFLRLLRLLLCTHVTALIRLSHVIELSDNNIRISMYIHISAPHYVSCNIKIYVIVRKKKEREQMLLSSSIFSRRRNMFIFVCCNIKFQKNITITISESVNRGSFFASSEKIDLKKQKKKKCCWAKKFLSKSQTNKLDLATPRNSDCVNYCRHYLNVSHSDPPDCCARESRSNIRECVCISRILLLRNALVFTYI